MEHSDESVVDEIQDSLHDTRSPARSEFATNRRPKKVQLPYLTTSSGRTNLSGPDEHAGWLENVKEMDNIDDEGRQIVYIDSTPQTLKTAAMFNFATPELVRCDRCYRHFRDKYALRKHLQGTCQFHQKGPFKEDFDLYAWTSPSLRAVNACRGDYWDIDRFHCPECSWKTFNPKWLLTHFREKHQSLQELQQCRQQTKKWIEHWEDHHAHRDETSAIDSTAATSMAPEASAKSLQHSNDISQRSSDSEQNQAPQQRSTPTQQNPGLSKQNPRIRILKRPDLFKRESDNISRSSPSFDSHDSAQTRPSELDDLFDDSS
ncbi:MAG: hypothetical protein Q9227_008225 [Pyrenula ochraceoflavens]